MPAAQTPLTTEIELLERCSAIEGLSLFQLADLLGLRIPAHPLQRKGWAGQAIELALGTTAGNKPSPDFCALGIELKTLPINHLRKPAESTFVTTIPLLTLHQQTWKTSHCRAKLRRILWLPIEADKRIPYAARRIGHGVLWSPTIVEEAILEKDWSEFTLLISTGRLSEINASMGEWLQVRPKAMNGKALCYGFDDEGNKVQTLPRGFYLRSMFTASLI